LLKLIKRLSPYKKNNNKKSWSDAMRLYNIRSGELELSVNYGAVSTQPNPPPQKKGSFNTWSSRLMLFTSGALVVGNIPVYSSVHVTAEQPELASTYISKQLTLPATPAITYSGYEKALDDSSLALNKGSWISYSIKSKDSLSTALANLQQKELYGTLSKNTDIKKSLAKLQSGSALLLHKVDSKVTQIIYLQDNKKAYVISRSGDSFVGDWSKDRVKLNEVNRTFTIASSLPSDAAKAKIPNRIINRIPVALKKDVDFRKIHIGDKIAVIYESIEFDGEQISSRDILAASYQTKNKLYERIRYTLKNGKTLYLSANGNDTQIRKTAFDRRPIRGGRLSSRFNPFRKHPIYRTIRPHTGTDIAAPRGTPIKATADGVIKFRGRKGGYGNVIDLGHAGRIKTRYAHMSGYKKGLHIGSHVKRGDVIGYVGSTGSSTGNHVHYEFIVNGRAVDSERVKLPTVGIISKQEQQQFRKLAKVMTKELKNAKQVASVGADFSEQYGG